VIERLVPAGPHHRVQVRSTSRVDGDFHPDGPAAELSARRAALAPGDWTWLRQVHGAAVVEVDRPGAHAGATGDASVTTVEGAVLAVQTADCAPVVLVADGALAVVHAGWRGIVAGVIPAALDALRCRTASDIHAYLGPHIGPSTYEFGEADLDLVESVVGDSVRSISAAGRASLDLGAAVRAQCCAAGGVTVDHLDAEGLGADTAGPGWFSHRIRGDRERQVTVAWLEPT
jgi:purine-nucleoside/S-methyl-5'-thioadenosine phosphorylase / adenosine deaminase